MEAHKDILHTALLLFLIENALSEVAKLLHFNTNAGRRISFDISCLATDTNIY